MENKKIAIVGPPNVGKSSIFNNLSGTYVTVSNYPGTTVEIFKTHIKLKGKDYQLIDTPGMYSLWPLSEEERVARWILLKSSPDVILQIGEAKNLEKTLMFTLQLLEAGCPLILVLNIMDEAKDEGIHIDIHQLENILGIPVVETVSVRNIGIGKLKEAIINAPATTEATFLQYSRSIEEAIGAIASYIKAQYTIAKRALSVLLLGEDPEIQNIVRAREERQDFEKIVQAKEQLKRKISQPLEYVVNVALQEKAQDIAQRVTKSKKKKERNFSRLLGDLTLKPLVGIPLLAFFLYFGIYKLVGVFGAGVCVDFLEGAFEKYVSPFFVFIFQKIIPFEFIRNLFVGEYGIITLGIRYAVAIVLPIVGIFFFVFSFAEDTGYLPRMGAMLDRLFKKIGLSGRAVIPIVLGLGCDTMATMVTRILPTRRERIIATFLLSLSVPCSAQLGVIMAVLSQKGWALAIWFLVISSVFAFSGFILNRILKGKKPSFHIELPPLRMPRMSNICIKTYSRLKWYFKEVLPLFIWASVFIWVGQITKLFDIVIAALAYPLRGVGLPDYLAKVFLFGFFRRDYGAAGLYDLNKQGLLSMREVLVAAVILTLFLPCIAQFLMNLKERGMKLSIGIALFILFFSFSVGFVLNNILLIVGIP
ncbi:MAG: ferrous iron transport protein B [Candidatus Omnitrophota bacterium]|nr:MAG: ferrous iron transport protein B [Candidatus Omnitrophota bacterium]